jgi:hypothetical protein
VNRRPWLRCIRVRRAKWRRWARYNVGGSGAEKFESEKRYVVKAVNGSNFAITFGGDVIKEFRPWEGDRLDLKRCLLQIWLHR